MLMVPWSSAVQDTGFETIEALAPVDILRRLKFDVTLASASDSIDVVSGQAVTIRCECVMKAVAGKTFDVVVAPGGFPNARLLGENTAVVELLKRHQAAGKWLAAICAAPARVLAFNGFFNSGAKGVCYPMEEFHNLMGDSRVPGVDTYIDREHKIVTSRGPGHAVAFAFAIAEVLNVDGSGVKSVILVN